MAKEVKAQVKIQVTGGQATPAPPVGTALGLGFERVVQFMTGMQNHVFTNSNVVCFEEMEKMVPGRHELHQFDGYGHQDVFMGKNVHVDIFPRIVEFLRKHSVGNEIGKAA